MDNDNNHMQEKGNYHYDTLVKQKQEQLSENGSEGYPYEDESGSNPEISTHYEQIETDGVQSYGTMYQDISSHSDVGNLMPVTSVYSVSDGIQTNEPYQMNNSPIVTTMISAVQIGHEQLDNNTVSVQFEPEPTYPPQVKVICPDQHLNEISHHRESREVESQHENPHEKHQESEEMNSTPTAHPDMSSLQQLANTQDPLVQNGIRVELQGRQLWRTFYEIGTEMIITKVGRRMFPAIRIKISGLKPHKKYVMMLDIDAVDDNRYRYVYHSSKWMVAGTADNPVPPRVYVHPESPATGENWMRQIVSFDKLKLTNHENDTQGHMILHSMHKYQPRVHVIEVLDENNPPSQIANQRVDINQPGITTFIFRETQFITVTAYQNQQITRLKIDRNPFAKGFRNSGRNKPTQYDNNGPPMAGTYAAWRSTQQAVNAAAAAHQAPNSTKNSTEYEQVSMTTPVTAWSNQVQNHHTFQTHSGLHHKYATQHAYPSINNLSPSTLNAPSILSYQEADRHNIHSYPYSQYTLQQPCVQGNRQDQKAVEVTVLSNQTIPVHLSRSQVGQKRSLAASSHEDPYSKEARYEEEYVQSSDSPTQISGDIHPHHLHHHYNQYN